MESTRGYTIGTFRVGFRILCFKTLFANPFSDSLLQLAASGMDGGKCMSMPFPSSVPPFDIIDFYNSIGYHAAYNLSA